MAHVENATSGLADHSEGGLEDFIKDVSQDLPALFVDLLAAVRVGFGLVGNLAEALLDDGAKLVGFSAELFVAQRFHLRFEAINGLDAGDEALDFALVLGPENLT